MTKDVKTVDSPQTIRDPLIAKQKEDVAKMRASLLCCSDDPYSAAQAMKNITVLRVYHQISRIIKYLEMMDKIEDKLYESIDAQLDTMDVDSPVTWMTLLTIQEKMQKNMLDSQKLLAPYIEQLGTVEQYVQSTAVDAAVDDHGLLTKESRETIRSAAQLVLASLPVEGGTINE